MEITEVKVFPIQEEKLKAFVSVVFDQCFMVNDIKIIQGRDGLFISMPSRKKKNGEFKDVAHPLNNETRRMIEDRVLNEYERVLGERGEHLPAPPHPVHSVAPLPPLAAGGSDGGVAGLNGPGASAPLSFEAAVAAAASGAGTAGPPAAAVSAAPAAAVKPAAPGAQEAGGAQPGASAGEAAPQAQQASPEKTLDEIEEMHLRDSFWTVT
jgi:stage V sporulation protein G